LKDVDTELKEEIRDREKRVKKAVEKKEKEDEENGDVTPVEK